jgi:diadenylate cyclase
MANSWLPFAALPKFTMTTAFDILIVAVLIYQFILIVRGRRAAHILAGVGILALVYLGSIWLRLELLRTILATLAPYTAIALIVMFQSELRRIMARLGRRPFFGISRLERREVADEILLALPRLSQQRIGALIVVERKIGLKTFIESGVLIDAQISRDLLCAIFQPGGPLHDGAVIVQGNRVAAGACFLPLTTNPALLTELGTRHRAAIGISEETDCIALVVSEETGRISVADIGEIELDVPLERVEQKLTGHATRREARPAQVLPVTEPAVEDSPLEGSSVQRP